MKIITFIIGKQKSGKTYFTEQARMNEGVSVLNTGELVRRLSKNDISNFDNLYSPSKYDDAVKLYVIDGIANFLTSNKKLLFIDSFPRDYVQFLIFENLCRDVTKKDLIVKVLFISCNESIRLYRSILSGRSIEYFNRRDEEERNWEKFLLGNITILERWSNGIDTSSFGINSSNTEILIKIIDKRSGKRFKNHLAGDVGFDIECWDEEEQLVKPHAFTKLRSGIHIKVGDNSWGCLRPRSNAHFKRGLIVMEGTFDSGFCGEVYILVYNPTDNIVFIKNGDSLAQIIPIPKFNKVAVKVVDEFPKTERGTRGQGSTGGIDDLPFFARNEEINED